MLKPGYYMDTYGGLVIVYPDRSIDLYISKGEWVRAEVGNRISLPVSPNDFICDLNCSDFITNEDNFTEEDIGPSYKQSVLAMLGAFLIAGIISLLVVLIMKGHLWIK